MTTLHFLKKYAEQTNNASALFTINKYIKNTTESWTKGKYYLGGQIALYPDEIIDEEKIQAVKDKNNNSYGGPCNSWEAASMAQSAGEIITIENLVNEYKMKKRLNGLFRVLVFWIVPARKRAAERLYHPKNMKKYFNEGEIEFNSYLSYHNEC